jgi:hypothetical protein
MHLKQFARLGAFLALVCVSLPLKADSIIQLKGAAATEISVYKMPEIKPIERQLAHPVEDRGRGFSLPLPIRLSDGEKRFFISTINRLAGVAVVDPDPITSLIRSSCRARSTAC